MENRTGTNAIWAVALLTLLLIGPLPNLTGTATLNTSADTLSTTPTAEATTSAFDEQRATIGEEPQT